MKTVIYYFQDIIRLNRSSVGYTFSVYINIVSCNKKSLALRKIEAK